MQIFAKSMRVPQPILREIYPTTTITTTTTTYYHLMAFFPGQPG